jgi:AcrR family transcriptional regulator
VTEQSQTDAARADAALAETPRRDAGRPDQRRTAAAERRRQREAAIIAATRELFDARGVRDAQIDDVAKAVGVNRAIIYRHFTGKEELFALTLVGYLRELREALAAADAESADPEQRLRRIAAVFVDYGSSHPAFVDCGVTVLRMGPELLDELSSSALFRLGRAMTECLSRVVRVLREGREAGVFAIDDPDLVANTMYALGLGGLQLVRLGAVVHEGAPGVPVVVPVPAGLIEAQLVEATVALAKVHAA